MFYLPEMILGHVTNPVLFAQIQGTLKVNLVEKFITLPNKQQN